MRAQESFQEERTIKQTCKMSSKGWTNTESRNGKDLRQRKYILKGLEARNKGIFFKGLKQISNSHIIQRFKMLYI